MGFSSGTRFMFFFNFFLAEVLISQKNEELTSGKKMVDLFRSTRLTPHLKMLPERAIYP